MMNFPHCAFSIAPFSFIFQNQMREFLQYAAKEVTCMKEGMDNLKKTQEELSEFFCEDNKTFHMEECYKSLGSFCTKFKQAVTENAKRKEQEALAEQRRAQREAEELKKSKNGKTNLINLCTDLSKKILDCVFIIRLPMSVPLAKCYFGFLAD